MEVRAPTEAPAGTSTFRSLRFPQMHFDSFDSYLTHRGTHAQATSMVTAAWPEVIDQGVHWHPQQALGFHRGKKGPKGSQA